jgi:hypothetical protein
MSLEDKKEIVKAHFYNFDEDFICETYDITKDELNTIIEENKEYLDNLAEVRNQYEEGN